MDISFIIPFYNEKESIGNYSITLFPIIEDMMRKYEYKYEYVFINDGSDDDGGELVRGYCRDHKHTIQFDDRKTNQGLGAAIRSGIRLSKGEYIIVLDSDLSYRPEDVNILVQKMRIYPQVDCVSASPYTPSHNRGDIPFIRYIGSRFFNYFYSRIIGHDITCATSMFRLYKAAAIKSIEIRSWGFDVNAEILSKLIYKRYRIMEVPVVLHNREIGKSSMKVLLEVKRSIILLCKIYIMCNFPNMYKKFIEGRE